MTPFYEHIRLSGQRRNLLVTEDMLTSAQLYRSEVRQLPRLSVDEEQKLVKRARAGDADARESLIHSCLNYVGFMAARYQYYVRHDDYLDLVGIGNVAVVEHLDRSLLKDNPCAYLRGVVKYTILHYCFTHASLIARPQQSPPVFTVSMDDTTRDDEQPLSHRLAGEYSSPEGIQPDYAWLYQALEQLPTRDREVLNCHYGLYGRQPESLYELSRRMSTNVKGSIAYLIKYRALQRLRTLLMEGGRDENEGMRDLKQQALCPQVS